MSKIAILPEHIANKIAAGEVVERPASVVKELVENSLDAGAKRIKIEVVDGGKKKIQVADDGSGMGKEDLRLSIKRHATSKIRSEEDLAAIGSLGFRGEALSSIVSVSKLKLRSRTKDEDTGYELLSEGGKNFNLQPYGMPEGTQIVVEELFFNTPARQKFLRTAQTELRHITAAVSDLALSAPAAAFRFSHNGRTVLDLSGDQNRKERVKAVLGKTLSKDLLPVYLDHRHLKIEGFVGKPQTGQTRTDKQYLLLNGRAVGNKTVAAAVRQAYGTLLPAKIYPVFVLYIELPREMVDVNVHPRKEEVRFVNGNFIFNSVKSSVEHTLRGKDLTFKHQEESDGAAEYSGTDSKFYRKQSYPATGAGNGKSWVMRDAPYPRKASRHLWDELSKEKLEQELDILQVHNLYLVMQTSEGILIVDQHAAHERVMYEQFIEEYEKKKEEKRIQELLLPVTFDTSAADAEIIKENISVFEELGLTIEEFGRNTFKVNSVPQILQEHNLADLINEVVSDLSETKRAKDIESRREKAISYLACRGAVKAGDYLILEKREKIMRDLKKCKTEYTCPHGRPTKIEISLSELEKMFKRR